jgi:hypothetical protein
MFSLCDTMGHTERFETIEDLKEYVELRHAEDGGFEWISEIKDSKGRRYGCGWSLEIEQI